ncbi:UNVERIFIED_CONTAM: hypothetical protein PYX00_002671 [Menopon gallinae]|uniref:Large ribosomal subunit protein bL20m n=1 Tax=Menopon gallinae TaxID=328185 RepID=A0AAW2HYZ1_9NEOP
MRGPDRFWKRRKVLRMSAHFYGRKKQCYSIAIRYVQKALQYVTAGRKLRKERFRNLWEQRLTAAGQEHGIAFETLRQSLLRLDILLNRKVLTDLAVFEPRTFKSLAKLSIGVAKEEGLNGINTLPPSDGVFTRSMLKAK